MFTLNGNKPIWVRDNEHGFLLGKISDIGSDNVTIQLNDTRKVKKNLIFKKLVIICPFFL
jgi:hypothetical protein